MAEHLFSIYQAISSTLHTHREEKERERELVYKNKKLEPATLLVEQ